MKLYWAITTDKSGDTLLEMKIKISELSPNKKKHKQKNQMMATILMK